MHAFQRSTHVTVIRAAATERLRIMTKLTAAYVTMAIPGRTVTGPDI